MNQKAISTGTVTITYLENGIAVLCLGTEDESFVSFTQARMASLSDALDEIKSKSVRGLVITGPRPEMFCVGADVSLIQSVTDPELGAQAALQGQSIFAKIENLACTTVAAISGPCVGGGCEMSLACDIRLLSDHKASSIGLPEIKLGILPGFGGTQRLPRLIGLPKALDVILAGKVLRPQQAKKYGLVHEVVPIAGLQKRAENLALGFDKASRKKPSLVDRAITHISFIRNTVKGKVEKQLKKQTKGFYPAPPAALETVIFGLEKGMPAGLEREAKELGRLIVTPESKCLVNLFFLTEASKSIGKSGKDIAESSRAVVIGAGVMGAGIGGVFVKNEIPVILKDTSSEGLQRGKAQIEKYLEKLRYLTDAERSFMLNRVETTTEDSASIGNCNFAIEAIFEDLELKKNVLGDIAQQMPEEAIIATNTSSLSVSKIAAGIKNPARVVGMHFFNPVEKMPLVEIIQGEFTSDKTICVIAALATKLGKFPIVVTDVPGFLVNRTLSPYLNEAAFLLKDGFSIADIDKAATRFGMPMGPVRLLDEVGLDVAAHVAEIMINGYGERMKGPGFANKMLESGRKGKKTKAGFYHYDGKLETPYEGARELLEIDSSIRNPDLGLLERRLILSLINEGVRCLDEGVAGTPGRDAANQIDLGTVMGIGFPPFRGGLIHYAESLGAQKVYELLSQLHERHGDRFMPAEGIVARASSNGSFYAPC